MEAGILDERYYRYRKECGGLDMYQARPMKKLDNESNLLTRLVADLLLERQILKGVVAENL